MKLMMGPVSVTFSSPPNQPYSNTSVDAPNAAATDRM